MPLGHLRLGSSSSAPATPSYPFPLSPRNPATPNSSISASQPQPSPVTGLQLKLDSSELVFRAFGGDELNGEPVHLTGSLILRLIEATSFKHISLTLKAVARLEYFDALSGKRYHQEQTVFTNHSEFLPLCSDSTHTHTLQTGFHEFPFSLDLPSGLPASLRTFNGSGLIYYKLKAIAARPSNFLLKQPYKFEAKHFLRVSRSFPAEALEWSQTLDIENTWPGKISYEISLPRKAFAAGETIPISIKFTPLVKGVRVTSLIITIKEHVSLIAKPGSAPFAENREVVANRFELKGGSIVPASTPSGSNVRVGPLTPNDISSLTNRLRAVSTGNEAIQMNRELVESTNRAAITGARNFSDATEAENFENASGELDQVVGVNLPASTTPSHSIPPITVNHKIRFSAFISNPDGHTSELRCALPLHVLANELMAEAALAAGGNGTNAMVFGPSGTLIASQVEGPTDLPSYSDHIRDRLAPIASAANRPSLIPAPWSVATTPSGSPRDSPSGSRRSSISHSYFPPMRRWNDPELARSLDPATDTDHASRGRSSHTSSRTSSRANSPTGTNPFLSAPSSSTKFSLRLPKALTRMAQQLSVTSTPNHSGVTPRIIGNHSRTSSTDNHHAVASTSANTSESGHDQSTAIPAEQAAITPDQPHQKIPLGSNHTSDDEESQEDVLSRVPSYSVASQGSLGGGPVPISSLAGLPSYDDVN